MKILLATYWHVPHLGGVWPYMIQKKSKLEELGHEVDLLGYGDIPGSYVHLVNKGIRIETEKLFPLLREKLSRSMYPAIYANPLIEYTEFRRYAFELAVRSLDLQAYDLVHTQDVISTVSINRIRPRGIALVATLHGCVAHEIKRTLAEDGPLAHNAHLAQAYFNRMERTSAASAEYTVLANRWMERILSGEFQVSPRSMRVFQYGYDMEGFRRQMKRPSSMHRPYGKKVIIFTGRLVEIKGVHMLLDALRLLKQERKDWVCWLVGEGDQETRLQQQANALGLGNDVLFLGSRDDVPALLGQADIFVLPSMIDNQPLALIEAQVAGKAIVTTDAGGLPEMTKHRGNGLLTPVGDTHALYAALSELLGNDAFRKLLGIQAQRWAMTHWSMDRMMDQLMDVYESAIAKRRKSAVSR
ncbi:glycosyltransferase family 4 protein [Paenibacillus filicis]|uniref:Glycosyltransferase family 4 protein n=1 Tax=Paenibacillus filicis TaxID=669464 RepID=A0ABU9DP94_9BACL